MYTSDTDSGGKWLRISFVYLLISLGTALFGAVYEMLSHEVYSFCMLYAFLFPLAGGALPFLYMGIFAKETIPEDGCCTLYHSGIATVTVGSIVQGILDIYGTTNKLTLCYWIIGFGLILSAPLSSGLMGRRRRKRDAN